MHQMPSKFVEFQDQDSPTHRKFPFLTSKSRRDKRDDNDRQYDFGRRSKPKREVELNFSLFDKGHKNPLMSFKEKANVLLSTRANELVMPKQPEKPAELIEDEEDPLDAFMNDI